MNRSRHSLRRRLLAFLLIPLCGIGLIALFDAYRSARDIANGTVDRVLSGSALAIAERVFVNSDGMLDVDIPYVALDMLTSAAQDRVFYRIDDGEGRLVTGYDRLDIPDAAIANDGRFAFADSIYRGSPVRVAVYRGAASTGERSVSYRVSVAETTNARDAMAQAILLRTALRQFLLITAAAAIVWVVVTRSLRPLSRLEAAIGRRSPDDLRPIAHDVPAEVGGLVDGINGFMGRLDAALNALRHFTGNASHQLRTPLAILRTQLSLARRSSDGEQIAKALEAGDEAVVEAERTLEQLLLMARIDEASSTSILEHRTDLAAAARAATEARVITAARAGFDLGFEGEGEVLCRGDAVLLREMVGNLIDNAIRHAAGGSEIGVSVDTVGNRAELTVADNGAGIPKERHAHVLQRYETRSDERGGSQGLGLPIVNEIATLFGGAMALSQPETGSGLRVTVRLPLV